MLVIAQANDVISRGSVQEDMSVHHPSYDSRLPSRYYDLCLICFLLSLSPVLVNGQ